MYEINIEINNQKYNVKHEILRIISKLFIEKLENIANLNTLYKNIIINSRMEAFNKKDKDQKIVAKSSVIDYCYSVNKSTDYHFKCISEQLKNLKKNFEKENISFNFSFIPETWQSVPREPIDDISQNSSSLNISKDIENINKQRNVLYFGAPGTGKSFEVDLLTKNKKSFRTMFHEEYSYFDFIGQYKPMVSTKSSSGWYINAQNEKRLSEEPVILYDYVAGHFIRAYIEAKLNPDTEVYFIIEEINRGNCAAIFGDIFQLLDRNENNQSKYPILNPVELKDYLKNKNVPNPEILSIPENLFIIGTMNTSDQSLYPMDSAFKRRWNMQFIPIDYKKDALKTTIIEGSDIKWLDFLQSINELIGEKLESENKMLGQWFVKANNNIISEDDFKNKVLHYLYYDVFKHDRKSVFNEIQFSKIFNKDIKTILKILMRKDEN